MGLHADLASLSSTLDQMIERVDSAATSMKDGEDEDLLGDLYEVERHLRSATRRLNRVLTAVPPSR
jgi:hypothetical protein